MSTTYLGVERQFADMKTETATADLEHSVTVAHQFDSMNQQYEAAKLGMWLFLGTEVLLFGGLFCIYAVFRGNNPGLFTWGSGFLDVKFGAANTAVLIISSLSMALAVSWAQLGRHWPVVISLSITFLCGVVFMAIKSVEYEHKFHDNLVWGLKFYEIPPGMNAGAGAGAGAALMPGDSDLGLTLWKRTCRACHGISGEGVIGQGRDIRSSEFIQDRDDPELVAYINEGRLITDPLNTTGMSMPPKGGNPMFTDQDLMHIVAYVRTFQIPLLKEESDAETSDVELRDGEESGEAVAEQVAIADEAEPVLAAFTPPPPPLEEGFYIPFSSVPNASRGPTGFDISTLAEFAGDAPRREAVGPEAVHHSIDPERPANAHIFFGIYFMMTGLHGLHVLGGMALIAWLIYRTAMGHFGRKYYTPVDLGGLYWHIVDLIWIFLFPMFYLIS